MIFKNYRLRWKKFDTAAEKEKDALGRYQSLNTIYTDDKLMDRNNEFYADFVRNNKYIICIAQRTDIDINLYVAVRIDALDCESDWENDIKNAFPDCGIVLTKEATVGEFKEELDLSHIARVNRVMQRMNIDYSASWGEPYPFDLSENVPVIKKMNKTDCKKRAKEILGSKSLYEELDRIYSKENSKAYYGHPVHYMISAGDWGAATDICELLISALSANGRLLSARQTILRKIRGILPRDDRYEKVIGAAEGGIAIIELVPDGDMGRFATDFHEITKRTGKVLEKNKKDTLFIFVEITGKSLKSSDAMNNILSKADIIQINEGSGTYSQAKQYLAELVSKVDFASDEADEAARYLPDADSYSVTDIFNAYNAWYGSGLKNHIYKAYKEQKTFKAAISKGESKPYEELQAMIGLTDAKRVIDDMISASKMLRVRERMGLNTEGSSLHMLFSGNPGTAKTTVARLLAKILKDEDAVRTGRFIECGRQDLVGRYVGWTAKIVEEKFRQASGGVLFIDEAYSLVEDGNTYGAEAINTITQLMENYRNDVIVIFAGYPDKMKTFLEQNEGLKSRIAFHMDFPDYSSEELVGILKLLADKREYSIEADALEYSREIFEAAVSGKDFGNGRYARNLLEQAIMHQSNRIVTETPEDRELSKEEICALRREDFRPINQNVKSSGVKLGFSI